MSQSANQPTGQSHTLEENPKCSDSDPVFEYRLTSLSFSDGTKTPPPHHGVCVLVGPNNAGKSQALRDISGAVAAQQRPGLVVKTIQDEKLGGSKAFEIWLAKRATFERVGEEGCRADGLGIRFGGSFSELMREWDDNSVGSKHSYNLLQVLLDTEKRLTGSNSVSSYDAATATPDNPLQQLYEDHTLEATVSGIFREAFGQDLLVGRFGGSRINLHVGTAPNPNLDGAEHYMALAREIAKLPLLSEQGDGMRSFATSLMYSTIREYPLTLVDEPEAFLHPSAARLLGAQLARGAAKSGQVFIATHSGDVLRGLLSGESTQVQVVRLTRARNVNSASVLSSDKVRELWNDPLLRTSNILDGLFHKAVVLCESDSDARFYSAVLDALPESKASRPDIMFCHCGGKGRMPRIVEALTVLSVPVHVIVDMDILNNSNPLKALWEATGGNWSDIKALRKRIDDDVRSRERPPTVGALQHAITPLNSVQAGERIPAGVINAISATLRTSGGWRDVKNAGKAGIPPGEAYAAFENIEELLRGRRVHVVPVGELEGFNRKLGGHGPDWAAQAVQQDLSGAAEYEEARSFIHGIGLLQESGSAD